jgi:hypothetical protein
MIALELSDDEIESVASSYWSALQEVGAAIERLGELEETLDEEYAVLSKDSHKALCETFNKGYSHLWRIRVKSLEKGRKDRIVNCPEKPVSP